MIWLILTKNGQQHRIIIHVSIVAKTKLKWNHLWEQVAPGVSGPVQLVYSVYREDRLWIFVMDKVKNTDEEHCVSSVGICKAFA